MSALWSCQRFIVFCLIFHVQTLNSTCLSYEAEVQKTHGVEKLFAYNSNTGPVYNESLRKHLRQYCPGLDDRLKGTTCCGEILLHNMNSRLSFMQTWIRNCSACFQSYADLMCHLTCDVNQAPYIKVNKKKAVLNPLPDRPKFYIQSARMFVQRTWLRRHMRDCSIYGVLDHIGQSLMDDACVYKKQCSPTVWLRNIFEYIDIKDLTFRIFFEEGLDDNAIAFGPNTSFSECPAFQIKPSDSDIILTPPDARTYPYGPLMFYALIYGVLLFLFLLAIFWPSNYSQPMSSRKHRDLLKQPSRIEVFGDKYQRWLRHHFMFLATTFSQKALSVIFIIFCCVLMICSGCVYFSLIHLNDFEKWSTAQSRARSERSYVNDNFRLIGSKEIIYLQTNDESMWYGKANHKNIKNYVNELVITLSNLKTNDSTTISNFCQRIPSYSDCVLTYYMHFYFDLEKDVTVCLNNPSLPDCIPLHGYPVDKSFVASGFKENGTTFNVFKITIANKHISKNYPMLLLRSEWEYLMESHLEVLKPTLAKNNIFLTYLMAHNQVFVSHVKPGLRMVLYVSITSFVAHLIYLSLILRMGNKPRIFLALGITSINVLSIISACGLLSYVGFKASEIMLDVMPCVVMSVGADNMVVLVLFCQSGYRTNYESKTFGTQIGRSLCLIGSTLRVNALCSILCSFLAAMGTNTYSQALAIYMAVALTINWLLQETCFLAILALDLQHQSNRKGVESPSPYTTDTPKSLFDSFLQNQFTPLLRRKMFQAGVILMCVSTMCCNWGFHFFIQTGEDMSHYWPKNNKVREFLEFDKQTSETGPPIYFVVSGGLDFSINLNRVLIDDEYEWSIPNQIRRAARFSPNSYMLPTSIHSWWNDFQLWIKTPDCCFRSVTDNKFCQPKDHYQCVPCEISLDSHKRIPKNNFYNELSEFLLTKPANNCLSGGMGRYFGKLKRNNKNEIIYVIEASHSVLRTTDDYVRALRATRSLCAKMTEMAQTYLGKLELISQEEIANFKIFPYSQSYLIYDQYLEIWTTAKINVACALAGVFLIHLLVAGLNWLISLLLVVSVSAITINIFGGMYMLDMAATLDTISFAVICVGITPSFVAFFLDTYSQSLNILPENRQSHAVRIVARPILLGVIGNKLFWLAPLAFSEQWYFNMYSVMIVSGLLTSVLYLPTIVYVFNPRPNKAAISNLRNQMRAKQRQSVFKKSYMSKF